MANIALNKTVICSEPAYQTYTSNKITDGNADTGYLTASASIFTATLLLGAVYTCESITIRGFYYRNGLRTKDITVTGYIRGTEVPLGDYIVPEDTRYVNIDTNSQMLDTLKIYVKSNYAGESFSSGLGEIIIDGKLTTVSCKNANLIYTIPMNTTSQIKSKVHDARTGLLGMASDPDNFGDLYVVGRDGKAHLTKSGIKSEVIFDGVANATGQYNLVDSIDKYSYLIIMAKITHSNSYFDDSTSDIIYKSEFENMKYKCISSYFSEEAYYAIEYKLTDNILDIYAIKNGTSSMWTTPYIYQIIGVY